MAEDFVDHIYEAAVVPEIWPTVLHDMMRMTEAMGAALIMTRGQTMRWVTSSPLFEQFARDHYELFPGSDRTRRLLECRHAGFITDSRVYSPEEMETEPLFRDFLIPRGGGSGVATAIQSPSGDAFILHAERPYAMGPVEGEILDRLDLARPHFARAALLSARLEMQRAQAAAQVLELLGLPGAVLRDGGRVLAGNQLFAELVPDLVQDRLQRLTLTDPGADKLFADALAQLGRSFDERAVRSIPIRAGGARPPYILHVVPVRGVAHDILASAAAVVIFTAVTGGDALPAELVQGLFDLTPSEARIAVLVGSGVRPREAARELHITMETARTTLKRVFAKVGVSRQSEFSALLARLAIR